MPYFFLKDKSKKLKYCLLQFLFVLQGLNFFRIMCYLINSPDSVNCSYSGQFWPDCSVFRWIGILTEKASLSFSLCPPLSVGVSF